MSAAANSMATNSFSLKKSTVSPNTPTKSVRLFAIAAIASCASVPVKAPVIALRNFSTAAAALLFFTSNSRVMLSVFCSVCPASPIRCRSRSVEPPNFPNTSIAPCAPMPSVSSVCAKAMFVVLFVAIFSDTNASAPTISVSTNFVNVSAGSPMACANICGDLATSVNSLDTAVAPLSGLIESSERVVDKPIICAVVAPKGTPAPAIRPAKSTMLCPVAFPCASRKLTALPSFRISSAAFSVLKSVRTLRSPANSRVRLSTFPN